MEQTSKYEPVAEKLEELEEGEGIIISDLAEVGAGELEDFLYRRFGQDGVSIRIAEQDDGSYKSIIFLGER